MPLKHNKKRNIGLLVEFFSKYIAECGITPGRHSDITKAKNIWDKHIKKSGNEIRKELQLFTALNENKFSGREVAYNLLQQVKRSASKIDAKKLEKEKTELIKEINNTFSDGPKFFDKAVENYTNYATIQILLDSWIGKGGGGGEEGHLFLVEENVINPAMTELEDQVLENMCKKKDDSDSKPNHDNNNSATSSANKFLKLTEEDINGMVVNIMTKKMNEKFSNTLTFNQKKILQQFVFGNDMKKLSETLSSLRDETLVLIKEELVNKKNLGKSQKDKMTEIKGLLESKTYKDTSNINDTNIIFYMSISKLNEELKEDNEES